MTKKTPPVSGWAIVQRLNLKLRDDRVGKTGGKRFLKIKLSEAEKETLEATASAFGMTVEQLVIERIENNLVADKILGRDSDGNLTDANGNLLYVPKTKN